MPLNRNLQGRLHPFWDADAGLLALFLERGTEPDGRAAVYIEHAQKGVGRRELVGFFDASEPLPAEWEVLPHWLLLKVPVDADRFAVELRPVDAGWRHGRVRLSFDRGVVSQIHSTDEARVYGFHAERSEETRRQRSRFRIFDFATQGDFETSGNLQSCIDAFRTGLAEVPRRLHISQIMQYSVRAGVFGPARSIFAEDAARELAVFGEVTPRRYDAEGRAGRHDDDRATRAWQELFSVTAGHSGPEHMQPTLKVHLGTIADVAYDLERRVVFLHIPANLIAAIQATSDQSPRKQQVLRALLGRSRPGLAAAEGEAKLAQVCHATTAEARQHEDGWWLRHDFSGVAMGDIVGVVVSDRADLVYRSGAAASAPGRRLYLRFLIDRMPAIDVERIKLSPLHTLIGRVIMEVEREHSESSDHVAARSAAAAAAPQRGLRLGERLWEALAPRLRALEAELTGPRRRQLMAILKPEEFQRQPSLLASLASTPELWQQAGRRGRGGREREEADFVAAAYVLAGHDQATLAWVKSHESAEQQAVLYDVLLHRREMLEELPRRNIMVPPDADLDAAARALEMLRAPDELTWASEVLNHTGDTDYADDIEHARKLFAEAPANADGRFTFDTLLQVRDAIEQAEVRVRTDLATAKRLLETRLSIEADDIEDMHAVRTRGTVDVKALRHKAEAAIRQRIPDRGGQAAAINELGRIVVPGVLARIVEHLDRGYDESTAKSIALVVARAFTAYACDPEADGRAGLDSTGPVPPVEEAEWAALQGRVALSGLLADEIRLAELVAAGGAATERQAVREVAEVARALLEIVSDARRHAETKLRGTTTTSDYDLRLVHGQFAALEAYGAVALATRVARRLNVLADDVREQLDARAEPLPPGAALSELARSWSDLGRVLAPDRSLRLMRQSLNKFDVFRSNVAPFLGPEGNDPDLLPLALPPPPRFAEIMARAGI